MKRRQFLKRSAAVATPLVLNGFPMRAEASNPLLEMIALGSLENGRKMVIIQLNGGNDGLNTVFPRDQYAKLLAARTNLLIPESAILPLAGFPSTGLHPALTEMNTLFNSGLLNITQSVSYPNPNFSHFRAADIWFTGSAADVQLNSGWVGRHLNEEFPNFPENYPNATMPDPLAVQIGSQASIMTQGPAINMCMTVTNPNSFYNLVNGIVDPAPPTPYGAELTYVRDIKRQSNAYNNAVKNAYNAATTLSTLYPGTNSLADQLKIVARLIKGGLKTPVFVVNHQNSFDTHSNQVDSADKTKGAHTNMLSALSKAIYAFQDDLRLMGKDELVFGMTFTEFGRRIKSNASMGTDHGAGVPMFFFGKKVNPAILGSNPVIPDNAQTNDNIPMQFDFRQVYYTILKKWFELTPTQLNTVMFQAYPEVDIFNASVALPVSFISFTGRWAGDAVAELTWVVDEESNIEVYEIMRSVNGSDYNKVGTVAASNSTTRHSYTYLDKSADRYLYYYRIRIVEFGGFQKNSEVVLLRKAYQRPVLRMKVMPNPVSDNFTLAFDEKLSGPISLRLIDTGGREVWKRVLEAVEQYNLNIRLSGTTINAGLYTLEVFFNNERATTQVIVQRK